ncbi:MAG: serine/threonine-protein kinase, partial [Gemmatimonadota bacterium]
MPETTDRAVAALAPSYRILGEIGQGGMATVYRAEAAANGSEVAVKVLDSEVASALGPARFKREIQIAGTLDHPRILPVLDSGERDGLLFYVMPLVRGESLRQRLEREGQLPLDAVLAIARGVAEGLDYAHGLGVVHRDIKPENILLEDEQVFL